MRRHLLTALLYGMGAAACRFALPDIKTRIQIVALIALVALFEIVSALVVRRKPNPARFLLSATAVALAAIAMKIALEGPRLPLMGYVESLIRLCMIWLN